MNKSILPIVVYSHSEYIDILNVQTSYIAEYERKILLINKNIESEILNNLSTNYTQIIFYDDSLPYASRLLALSELKDDYMLLLHDMDILVSQDAIIMDCLHSIAVNNSIDRIDLQSNLNYTSDNENNIRITDDCTASLYKAEDPSTYIYNVNPSIWKVSTLLNVMGLHSGETYRSIETSSIQNTCSKLSMYKIHGTEQLVCGYYCCHKFFQFLHLTHGGKYLPVQETNFTNELRDEYQYICENFLKNTSREFNTQR